MTGPLRRSDHSGLLVGRSAGDDLVDGFPETGSPALLRTPGFAAGLVAQLTLWCGQVAFFFVLALYLQQGRGLGALEAGLVFTFCAVSYVGAATAAAGLGERFARRVVVAGGAAPARGARRAGACRA